MMRVHRRGESHIGVVVLLLGRTLAGAVLFRRTISVAAASRGETEHRNHNSRGDSSTHECCRPTVLAESLHTDREMIRRATRTRSRARSCRWTAAAPTVQCESLYVDTTPRHRQPEPWYAATGTAPTTRRLPTRWPDTGATARHPARQAKPHPQQPSGRQYPLQRSNPPRLSVFRPRGG